MKLGLRLPQRLGVDLQHDVVEAARTAEAAGYASLWTYERLLFPKSPLEPYAPPNVPWPEHSRQVADSLAVLTAAAVATEQVRLGTALLIAAQHTPVQLAKALATIDQISGGRMIAGMAPAGPATIFGPLAPPGRIAAASSTRRWTSLTPCGGRTR